MWTPAIAPTTGWHWVNYKENNLGKGQALPISGPPAACAGGTPGGALAIRVRIGPKPAAAAEANSPDEQT
jgi:hypothetical protein